MLEAHDEIVFLSAQIFNPGGGRIEIGLNFLHSLLEVVKRRPIGRPPRDQRNDTHGNKTDSKKDPTCPSFPHDRGANVAQELNDLRSFVTARHLKGLLELEEDAPCARVDLIRDSDASETAQAHWEARW